MGEASAGRSATSPTFFRSTSVRTRMEWQNSQVVCTALDQRKVTGAPQLGQFAAGALMADRDARLVARRLWTRLVPFLEALQNRDRAGGGSKKCLGRGIRTRETCGR